MRNVFLGAFPQLRKTISVEQNLFFFIEKVQKFARFARNSFYIFEIPFGEITTRMVFSHLISYVHVGESM